MIEKTLNTTTKQHHLPFIYLCTITLCISVYFIFDYPMLFTDQLIISMDITTVQIGYLYSIYSIPNLICVPIGGIIIGYLGSDTSSLLLTAVVFFGSIFNFLGVLTSNYYFLLIGRAIGGMGSQTLVIVQAVIVDEWFSGRLLSVALGSCNFLNFMSASADVFFSPQLLVKSRNLVVPFFVASCVAFLSWTSSFFYYTTCQLFTKQKSQKDFKDKNIEKKWKFGFYDLRYLSGLYWLVMLQFVILTLIYYQFMSFVTDLLVVRYQYSYIKAKNIVALVPVSSALLLPFFSIFTLYYGKKALILLFSSLSGTAVFTILLLSPEIPSLVIFFSLGFLAIFFSSQASVIWPSITLVVPKEATGVSLAVSNTILNVFMTIMPVVFGNINKPRNAKAYRNSIWVLLFMAILSVGLSVLAALVDYRGDRMLYLGENDKKVLELRNKKSLDWIRAKLKKSSFEELQVPF